MTALLLASFLGVTFANRDGPGVMGTITFTATVVSTASMEIDERPTGIEGASLIDVHYTNNGGGGTAIDVRRTYLVVAPALLTEPLMFVAGHDDVGVARPEGALVYRLIPGDEDRVRAFVALAVKRSRTRQREELARLLVFAQRREAELGISSFSGIASLPGARL